MELTHIDNNGNAIMVDVSDKACTKRVAIAKGVIRVNKETFDIIKSGSSKKGDVLAVARVAGIMATKRTSDLIPLCHPLALTKATVDFELNDDSNTVTAVCTAALNGVTGVEMEAITGVSVALITIYDMCKAVDKGMVIDNIHLVHKEGGKSGNFDFKEV